MFMNNKCYDNHSMTINIMLPILRYEKFLFDIDYRDTLISRYMYDNIVILPNSTTPWCFLSFLHRRYQLDGIHQQFTYVHV